MNNKHAIIIIKDKENKYLQYYDEIWKSYLFLNCKIEDETISNRIIDQIKTKYNITIKNIELIGDKIHTKLSQKDQKIKEYHHYFYKAILEENNSNNTKYFTYNELLNDKRIQEVNSDIVSYIKELEE